MGKEWLRRGNTSKWTCPEVKVRTKQLLLLREIRHASDPPTVKMPTKVVPLNDSAPSRETACVVCQI